MFNKRGQITIFIIIAILIIGAVALFFTLRKPIEEREVYAAEVAPVKNFVEECIEDQLPYGVGFIGLQGGYSTTPEKHVITEFSEIAYGYYNGRNTLVTLPEMENQISSFMRDVLPLCVDETAFPSLTIKTSEPEVKTKIETDYVFVEIDFPITIIKNESVSEIRDFEAEVPVRLEDMHKTAEEIIKEKLDSNYIDLTYLSELDYIVNILPQDENVFIYSIIDEKYKLNNVSYVFNFAVKK